MTVPTRVAISTPDPVLAAIEVRHPIDLDVIATAINYREALLDQLTREIQILKVARARILNRQGS